jgi:hypothetical protein
MSKTFVKETGSLKSKDQPVATEVTENDHKGIMMIHRRVKALSNKYELDLVRLPHKGYLYEDVDTIIPGNNDIVVASGRRQGHEHKYGGISIQSYDDNSDHKSEDGRYQREVGEEPNYGPKPGRNITRWHCYKCPRDDIPSKYGVFDDNPPHHGYIYPVSEINVTDLHRHDITTFPVGRFAEIGSISSWIFCCNVLDDQNIIVAEGKPREEDFKDKGIVTLFYALQLCSSSTSFCDESNDCHNIKKWIILNNDVEDSIPTISRKAPDNIYFGIRYHLENAQAYTSFCDESDSIFDVLNLLIKSRTNSVEKQV